MMRGIHCTCAAPLRVVYYPFVQFVWRNPAVVSYCCYTRSVLVKSPCSRSSCSSTHPELPSTFRARSRRGADASYIPPTHTHTWPEAPAAPRRTRSLARSVARCCQLAAATRACDDGAHVLKNLKRKRALPRRSLLPARAKCGEAPRPRCTDSQRLHARSTPATRPCRSTPAR